jgi:hypothetical protein
MPEADIPLEEGHNNDDMGIDKGSKDEDLGFPDGIIVTFGQVGNQKAAQRPGPSSLGVSSVCFVHPVSGDI